MSELSDPEQLALMRSMVETSASNSLRSARNCYSNSERNLSSLIHVAVMLMVLGLAVDRYQWSARDPHLYGRLIPLTLTSWSGAALIGLGLLMTLIGGLRFAQYVFAYRNNQRLGLVSGMFLPSLFALFVTAFSAFLLIALFLPV